MANIKVGLKLDDDTYHYVDKNNGLKSLESLTQSTGQENDVYYGVTPSSGYLEINDKSKEILELINSNKLPNNNMQVNISVNNKQVKEHITTDSEYGSNNVLTLSMEDILNKLDSLQFKPRSIIGFNSYDLSTIIAEFRNITGKTITISAKAAISASGMTLPSNVCLPPMTYRELFDKICYLFRWSLVEKDDGNLEFVDASTSCDHYRDNYGASNIIKITPNMVVSDISRNVIVKNKIEKITYTPVSLNVINNDFIENVSVDPKIDYDNTNMWYKDVQYSAGYDYTLQKPVVDLGRSESYRLSGTFTIPKSYNILSVADAGYPSSSSTINKNTFTLKGKKRTVWSMPMSVYANKNATQIEELWSSDKSLFSSDTIGAYMLDDNSQTITEPLKTEMVTYTIGSFDHNFYTSLNAVVGDDLNQFRRVREQETDTEYVFYYSIVIHQAFFHQKISGTYTNYDTQELIEGQFEDIEEITFNIYGSKVTINPNTGETIVYGDSTSQNEIFIPYNEFITSQAVGDALSQRIIADYEKGISTAKLTISCLNMYYTDGDLAKDFSKGEILQVGDYVRIDKDQQGNSKFRRNNYRPYLWKVVGRKFKYSGVPLIELTLQEAKESTYDNAFK